MEDKEHARSRREKLKEHPRKRANLLTHFFFCWEIPVIFRGWKEGLAEDELYTPLKEYESKRLTDELEKLWLDEEHFQKHPSLWRCLIQLFGLEYMLYGLLYTPIHVATTLLQPFLLGKVLDFYNADEALMTEKEAHLYAGGLALSFFVRIFSFHFFVFVCTVVGIKVRVACTSLVYRKAILMKKTTLDKVSVGQLVNLMSNDVTRFDQLAPYFHFIWIGLVELVVGMYYLDAVLGHAALGGVAVVFLQVATQGLALVQVGKSRGKVALKTDYRIKLMNDVICGIEAIKMYTWERPFVMLVDLARKLELHQIKVSSHIRLFIGVYKIYMGKFCVFFSILVAVLTSTPLSSQYAFSLVSIYENLKVSMVIFLPLAAIMFAETVISVRRIQDFLLVDHEKTKPVGYTNDLGVTMLKFHEMEKRAVGIQLEDVSVRWEGSTSCVLKRVDFKAGMGELVGVVGTAGCGKSTLLQVILKEVLPAKGRVEVVGGVSYASQEAWIFPTSIKQNILFGQDFVSERYRQVVRVCALERDFTLFPYGDQTLVGERGAMLSGGQRARINLARAVYKEADIYLLDDPLSAVDSHVAKHITDECINGFLSKKCVVLVTHQVQHLRKATRTYQIESGSAAITRNYEGDHEDAPTNAAPTTLTQHSHREEVKEHRSSDNPTSKVYKSYCDSAGHYIFTVATLMMFVLGQVITSLSDLFLTYWTNLGDTTDEDNYLYIYMALVLISIVVNHLATFIFTAFCMKASKTLHQKMLSKVVYSPMSFFNDHPSGRMLNRFSKDMGCIDELLPTQMMNWITVVLTGAAVLVIIVLVNYWMVLPSLVLLGLLILGIVLFQPSNRSIKRTEGITRSSVFTHISTTLQGLSTIRAHNAQARLTEEFDEHQNTHSSAYYLFTATFAAFGFWTDFLSAVYTTVIIFSFFLLGSQLHPGTVGLAITQSINLLGMVQYGVKTFGELDSQMMSVERVVEYAELSPEKDEGTAVPPDSWPARGAVTFEGVSLRYSPNDPPVLKNVSFAVQSGEKVGIIGRTGAGKTSLISVIFRLFHFDGTVTIDGVDTKSMPLHVLRSKISIIPQEPILFHGTLRKNIDPFDEYQDHQLWKVLEELELKPMVTALPLGLESLVTERGSNFSVGQRQLLCLVRAMLRNNKVIVLDEATANVDLKTDELIQSVVRSKFEDCTVLTIAHRLNTIIDSDKVLAMDGGRVVEFDHPYRLLQNRGFFYGFVEKSGEKVVKEFTEIARRALEKKEV